MKPSSPLSSALVRVERADDVAAIHALHASAFPADDEARLVDALRRGGHLPISLVAELDGRVVGHVAFSPGTVDGTPGGFALAPVAVEPALQRRGIGSALIRAGLDAARSLGCGYVVLLGDPDDYPRFGFRRASELSLSNEHGADDAFPVLELRPGALPSHGGLVRDGSEFSRWS